MLGIDSFSVLRALPSFFLIGVFVSVIFVLPDCFIEKPSIGKHGRLLSVLRQIYLAIKPVVAAVLLVINFYVKLDGVIRLVPFVAFLVGFFVCKYSFCVIVKNSTQRLISWCKRKVLSIISSIGK